MSGEYTVLSPVSQKELPHLTPEDGQVLVALARQTLALRLKRKIPQQNVADLQNRLRDTVFSNCCGVFVTLKVRGDLRGCIGSLVGRDPLRESVRSNAISAAFHDPRFPPLEPRELEQIHIEVSVLTASKPLRYKSAADLLEQLRPRIDGVTIRKDLASATFLPQVWDQLPQKETFLKQLCLKAGLPADAWRQGDLEIETYQVEYFEEPL